MPAFAARRREFGDRLRELRLGAGMTQEQLADSAGLHRTYVGSVERGERNVSLVAMWQLAEVLRTTPAAFFPATAE
jgi:transcriptional regulator with XRE-family HTH domain